MNNLFSLKNIALFNICLLFYIVCCDVAWSRVSADPDGQPELSVVSQEYQRCITDIENVFPRGGTKDHILFALKNLCYKSKILKEDNNMYADDYYVALLDFNVEDNYKDLEHWNTPGMFCDSYVDEVKKELCSEALFFMLKRQTTTTDDNRQIQQDEVSIMNIFSALEHLYFMHIYDYIEVDNYFFSHSNNQNNHESSVPDWYKTVLNKIFDSYDVPVRPKEQNEQKIAIMKEFFNYIIWIAEHIDESKLVSIMDYCEENTPDEDEEED